LKSKDKLREVISYDAIQKRIEELGARITEDYKDKDLIVIGILKGAFIFMSDLIRAIDNPFLQVDFVRLASYGASTERSGTVAITKDIEIDIKNQEVLVVEDIIDTGYTLQYLKELLELHKPSSVRICCLIDKKERREVPIEVDYVGFDVSRGFLVGYGLDFDERYRNLKGIYHIIPGYEPEGFVPSDR